MAKRTTGGTPARIGKPCSFGYITSRMDPTVREAFAFCQDIARKHYENFPVASLFIPRNIRPYIAAVYAFARAADDFADEGTIGRAERLVRLNEWRSRLDRCYEGDPEGPVFIALAETASRTGLPKDPLADLLTAFRMDVEKTRFSDFSEILTYCRFSANPIGRIVLHLFDDAIPEKLLLSDRICTGLQLVNFWQDVSVDILKGRVYLPLDDLSRFGYTETELQAGKITPGFRELLAFEVGRARDFLESGQPLVHLARPNLRFELNLTVLGGLTILAEIEKSGYDVLHHRPHLSTAAKLRLLGRALLG
jgi:squalene synthase HpnC